MSACVAEDRRAWGSLAGEVHQVIVDGYEETGVSPPAQVIAERVDAAPAAISRALKSLLADGLIAQPYGARSGYIPLYRPDGTQVRPMLVEVKDGIVKKPESTPPTRSITELLQEVLQRVESIDPPSK